MRWFIVLTALVAWTGCSGGNQPDFGELHPVKGTVLRGGQPVAGGVVQFYPIPDKSEFLINSEVAQDGTFVLSTVRTTDTHGERKPGVVAGQYRAVYTPPNADQTAGYQPPIELPDPIAVESKENDLQLELPGGGS